MIKDRLRVVCGPNRKGVMLSAADLKVLMYIANSQLVTAKQIDLYHAINGQTTLNTTRSRLKRWTKYDLVVPTRYPLNHHGIAYHYYRIGKKGLEILVEQRLLDEVWLTKEVSKHSQKKKVDHFLATQELVVRCLNGLNNTIEVDSYSPYSYPYLEKNLESRLIVPDWILKSNTLTLNIELDTGTETQGEISSKIERYVTLAKQRKEENHAVLFAVMDNSFLTRTDYGDDRSRRIGNIKNTVLAVKEVQQDNLDFYVVSLQRAYSLSQSLLKGERPLKRIVREEDITSLFELICKFNNHFPYKVQSISEKIYPASISFSHYADVACTFRSVVSDMQRNVLIVALEEGNAKDLDRLVLLSHLSKEGKLMKHIDKVIGIYYSEEELNSDVLANHLSNVILGNRTQLIVDLEEKPCLYKTVSPYKVERCDFDEAGI